jgi:hypothetical protein
LNEEDAKNKCSNEYCNNFILMAFKVFLRISKIELLNYSLNQINLNISFKKLVSKWPKQNYETVFCIIKVRTCRNFNVYFSNYPKLNKL